VGTKYDWRKTLMLVERLKPGRNDGRHGCWTVVTCLTGDDALVLETDRLSCSSSASERT
jgi:hypothetical protein